MKQARFAVRSLLSAAVVCLLATEGVAQRAAPLPLGGGFVENAGQWESHVLAAGRLAGHPVALVDGGLEWVLGRDGRDLCVRLELKAASGEWRLEQALPGRHHYFTGVLRAPNLLAYGGARLEAGSEGLTLRATQSGGWLLQGSGEPDRWVVSGARVTGLGTEGELVLQQEGEVWRLPAPNPGAGGGWRVHSESEVSVGRASASAGSSGARGAAQATGAAMSPSVDWGTYLGSGGSQDQGRGADYDSQGRPVTCGRTESVTFPTTPGPFSSAGGGGADGFLTKLSADGTEIVFSSYLGGNREDYLVGLDLASNDEIGVLALTRSPDWPLTPGAYDSVLESSGSVYAGSVMRFSPDGSSLIFSTLYGTQIGDVFPRKFALARDDGSVVVAGDGAGSVPVTPESAFGLNNSGTFLAAISADGSELLFSTRPPCAPFIAEGAEGNLVIGGDAVGVGWGLPESFQQMPDANSSFNAWLGVVSADGRDLLAATYLWGSAVDSGRGIALDAAGNIFIGGTTASPDFPVVNSPLNGTPGFFGPAYVAKFDPSLQNLLWSALLAVDDPLVIGTFGYQTAVQGLACDASGTTTAFGWSDAGAQSFKTAGSHLEEPDSEHNGVIFRLAPDGSRVLYASSFELFEPFQAGVRVPVLARNSRTALLSGTTNGSAYEFLGFPTTPGTVKDACTPGCFNEAFLVQFNFFHEGVTALGEGGESCLGVTTLNTTRRADVGVDDFAFYASQAPPDTVGVLLLGQPLPLPVEVDGQMLWLALTTLVPPQVLFTQESGYVDLDLVVPPNAAGAQFAAQAAFLSTASCGTPGALILSEAISVSVP